MDVCTRCGAELGIGRFCTNCGHRVGAAAEAGSWRTDTAERPRVTVPPSVPVEPGPARFPLFADEDEGEPVGPAEPPRHRGEEPRRRAPWLPWLVGLVVLVLVATAGTWLLFSGEDAGRALAQETPTRSGDRSPGRDRTPEPTPEPSPTEEKSPDDVAPTDLARFTEVSAPAPAPPSTDPDGNAVRFDATNMIDGVAGTTWRMPGDGTGATITFRFDSPTVLGEVGLVNGYAKVGQDSAGLLDWYAGNRRVLEVEWAFDDGTVVTQPLGETAQMQTMPVADVETETVVLRLLAVSPPGEGRASRDYTAISDVRLLGTPIAR